MRWRVQLHERLASGDFERRREYFLMPNGNTGTKFLVCGAKYRTFPILSYGRPLGHGVMRRGEGLETLRGALET